MFAKVEHKNMATEVGYSFSASGLPSRGAKAPPPCPPPPPCSHPHCANGKPAGNGAIREPSRNMKDAN